MLENGATLSRTQYESLYKEIGLHFTIYQERVSDVIHCKIVRQTVMGTREIFGKVIECPIPTSNRETFSFHIKSSELIS